MPAVLIIHKSGENPCDLMLPYQEQEDGSGWWDWINGVTRPELPVEEFTDDCACEHVVTPDDGLFHRPTKLDDTQWYVWLLDLFEHYPDHVFSVVSVHS